MNCRRESWRQVVRCAVAAGRQRVFIRCRGACAPAPTAATTTGRTRVRFLDGARSRAQRGERFCERARGAAALWHPTAHYRRRRRPRGPPPDDRSAQRVGGEIGLDDVYLMNYYLKGRSAEFYFG